MLKMVFQKQTAETRKQTSKQTNKQTNKQTKLTYSLWSNEEQTLVQLLTIVSLHLDNITTFGSQSEPSRNTKFFFLLYVFRYLEQSTQSWRSYYLQSQNSSSLGSSLTCFCEYLLPRMFPSHTSKPLSAKM